MLGHGITGTLLTLVNITGADDAFKQHFVGMLGTGYEASLSSFLVVVTLTKCSTTVGPFWPNKLVNLEKHVINKRNAQNKENKDAFTLTRRMSASMSSCDQSPSLSPDPMSGSSSGSDPGRRPASSLSVSSLGCFASSSCCFTGCSSGTCGGDCEGT